MCLKILEICPQIAISLQWLLDVTKGGVVVSSVQLPEKILAFTFPTQKYFDAYICTVGWAEMFSTELIPVNTDWVFSRPTLHKAIIFPSALQTFFMRIFWEKEARSSKRKVFCII